MKSFIHILIHLMLTVPMTFTAKGRDRRQTFDFSMNTGDSGTDGNDFVPAKTLTASPPPLHVWNVRSIEKQNPDISQESENTQAQTTPSPIKHKIPVPDPPLGSVLTPTPELDTASELTSTSVPAVIPEGQNLPPDQDTPDSADVPCIPTPCLYAFHCLPHQDCVMDDECVNAICIDRDKPPPTVEVRKTLPQNENNSTEPTRNCPEHMNRCLFQNSSCLPSQKCAMNANCTDVICTDRVTPTPFTTVIPEGQNLPPDQDTPDSADVPCLPTMCLFGFHCLPHQDCAMDDECVNIICIDRDKPPPTVEVGENSHQDESETTEPTRNNCPEHMNRCLFQNNACLPSQKCAMNANCTEVICTDPFTPTPFTPTSTNKPSLRTDCPRQTNLCINYSKACTADQDCYMDWECSRMHCINKNSSQIQTSTPENLIPSSSTLRPESERLCTDFFTCVHGYCNDETKTCKCDKGWAGLKCHLPCTLDCVHGNCYHDINVTRSPYLDPKEVTEDIMKCNCLFGWHKRLCNERIPDLVSEAEKRTLKLGLSLGSLLAVVMTVSIITLVVLWRKRVIVVMKLVYFFKLDEDGDGRIYDAYISMGSSTQGMKFVMDELCPTLENSGFRLYIQARDQPIGEVVSNSILKVMEQSRRTILIITPDYLRNEWSRFECITAQIETLKLHQRIIPIILEDVSTEAQAMDRTLRHILDSVKCLKFPKLKDDPRLPLKQIEILKTRKTQKFWKRLELTMPKKAKKLSSSSSETEITQLDDHDIKPISFTDQNVKPIDITFTDMYSVV